MNIDDFEQMKNQDFAFACLQLLFSNNNEKRYISDLQNGEWCKDMGFMQRAKPILKAIPDGLSDEDLKSAILDGTSQSRYYSSVFVFDNKQYLVTNYWYGPKTNHPDNRTPFLNWIKQQII